MKQFLLLLAVYALIINRSNKDTMQEKAAPGSFRAQQVVELRGRTSPEPIPAIDVAKGQAYRAGRMGDARAPLRARESRVAEWVTAND